jgi:hypothetical protein
MTACTRTRTSPVRTRARTREGTRRGCEEGDRALSTFGAVAFLPRKQKLPPDANNRESASATVLQAASPQIRRRRLDRRFDPGQPHCLSPRRWIRAHGLWCEASAGGSRCVHRRRIRRAWSTGRDCEDAEAPRRAYWGRGEIMRGCSPLDVLPRRRHREVCRARQRPVDERPPRDLALLREWVQDRGDRARSRDVCRRLQWLVRRQRP